MCANHSASGDGEEAKPLCAAAFADSNTAIMTPKASRWGDEKLDYVRTVGNLRISYEQRHRRVCDGVRSWPHALGDARQRTERPRIVTGGTKPNSQSC